MNSFPPDAGFGAIHARQRQGMAPLTRAAADRLEQQYRGLDTGGRSDIAVAFVRDVANLLEEGAPDEEHELERIIERANACAEQLGANNNH